MRELTIRISTNAVRGFMAASVAALALGLVVRTAAAQSEQGGPEATKPQPVEVKAADGKPVVVQPVGSPGGDAAGAPSVEESGAQPKATIALRTHNFGEVWSTETLMHSFKISNTGQAPLKILQVKPACGCTVAGSYPREIAPGGVGEFPFKMSANKLRGVFTKTIKIRTNDPANADLQLALTGKIKYLVDTEPQTAQFGNVKEDEVAVRVVKIKNNTEEPLTLTMDETSTSETFKAELSETVPGKEFDLKITAQPPYEPRLNRHNITLKTNVPDQDTLTVLCLANNPPRLEVIPDSFRVSKTDKPQTKRIRLRNNGETPVALKEAKVENVANGAEWVKTREIAAGKQYEITVVIPADYEPGEGVAVVLHTDDSAKPELRIPITALPTRQAQATPQQTKRPAERLKGTSTSGAQVASHKGDKLQLGGDSNKIQVAVFYASWCGFCKRALPDFQKLHETYKDNANVEIIAINVDDRGEGKRARTEEESIKHYESMSLSLPLVLDSDKKLAPQYKVQSYPTTFLIGKDGKIEDVVMGAKPAIDKLLSEEVDLLLAGKPLPSSDDDQASAAEVPAPVKAAAAAIPPAQIKPAIRDGQGAVGGDPTAGARKEAEPKHD